MRVMSSEVKVGACVDLPATEDSTSMQDERFEGKDGNQVKGNEDLVNAVERLKDEDKSLEVRAGKHEYRSEKLEDRLRKPKDKTDISDERNPSLDIKVKSLEHEEKMTVCSGDETDTENVVEAKGEGRIDCSDQQNLKRKEKGSSTVKHAPRGASGHEKLVQCDNCKKIYRSSNLARHRRSCLHSDGGIESVNEETDNTNISSDIDSSAGEGSGMNFKGIKNENKLKESQFKVKICGLKNDMKEIKKVGNVSVKKVKKKSKQVVHDDKEGDSLVPATVNSGPVVKKEKARNKVCHFCQKTFAREKQLQDHIRTHTGEKPFQCALCGSTFGAEKTLDQHMKVHTGEKPYKCNVCGHTCSQLGNLQRHMRSHTNERPFLCTQCGFAFKEKAHLDGHVRIHTGERPYECTECHRRFSVSSSLQCHMRTHTGVKPVSCEYCGKKFARRTSLNQHIGKHLGVKIECEVCGAVFSHKRSLVSHMQIHETHKFACLQCGKTFYRKRNLTRHLDMHERRKRKKSLLSDGVITNATDISASVNAHLNEEVRNQMTEDISSFNQPATSVPEELAMNSFYETSKCESFYQQVQPETKEQDDIIECCRDNLSGELLLAQLEQDQQKYSDISKISIFQGPSDTLTNNVKINDQAISTESYAFGEGDNNCLGVNQKNTVAFTDFLETVGKSDCDNERKSVIINGQDKVSEITDSYKDRDRGIESMEACSMEGEGSSCDNLFDDEETGKESVEESKVVIVKQETMDADEEYGKGNKTGGVKMIENDKFGEEVEEIYNTDINEKELVMVESECESAGELDNEDIVVKLETEDDYSSDNTVIMEPGTLLEELKQSQEKEKKYACLYCTKKFSKSMKLKDHVRTHTGERPYQCEMCGSAFATVHTLKVHKRIHTGVKPYKCNVCGHAFAQLANLQSHLRTHSNERPFLCPQCGYAFKEKAHLDGHMFLHTGEKPYQCSLCDKRFPNKSALNTHKKNHLGVKPFPCQYCEKRFPRPYQLFEHLRTHTGNKIMCQMCNHEFTHMSSYKAHMRVHKEGRKYECEKCGKKFAQKRNLTRHVERKVKPCS